MSKRNRSSALSLNTRAMRRAHARADHAANDNARQQFLHVACGGTVVPDDDRTPLPYEAGKVCWSVEFYEASLNFNVSLAEMEEMAAAVDLKMIGRGDDARCRTRARRWIFDILLANEHLQPDGAFDVAWLAVWLALRGPQAPAITSGAAAACTFLILLTDEPGVPYVFRFIAGRAPRGEAEPQNLL